MTNDLGDDTFRILVLAAKIRQAHYNLMAGHCAHVLTLRNEHIGIDLLVIRYHKSKVLIFLVKANDGLVRALNHPDDRALRSFSFGSRTCRNLHGIPVHGIFGLLCRNEHILVHALNGHKTKAFGVAAERSDQGKGLRLSVLSTLGKAYFSVCHQGIQNLF